MAKKPLPKTGDKIPVDNFHVSETNMRYGEPFGEDEEDQTLIANFRGRRGKERERVAEPFTARPEGNDYGVYKGSRRFQAMKAVGIKEFVVGEDCIIHDVTDEEARDASWTENLEFLRKKVDPITRAQKLSERLAFSTLTLRRLAARDGVRHSTYSEWLKVLELSPKMQKVLADERIFFTDGLYLARMKLGTELQDKLAEVAETDGMEAFKKELVKVAGPGRRRGLPPGVYTILRITLDKRYKPDVELDEKLTELAKIKGMEKEKYCIEVLREHVKAAA